MNEEDNIINAKDRTTYLQIFESMMAKMFSHSGRNAASQCDTNWCVHCNLQDLLAALDWMIKKLNLKSQQVNKFINFSFYNKLYLYSTFQNKITVNFTFTCLFFKFQPETVEDTP